MKSFYPYQQENVVTVNSWTLADDFIALMESNSFYKQYVRWNVKRYRPCDAIMNEMNVESETEPTLPPILPLNVCQPRAENSNTLNLSQNKQDDQEVEVTHTSKPSICKKRRFEPDEPNEEKRQTRTQTGKLRKT